MVARFASLSKTGCDWKLEESRFPLSVKPRLGRTEAADQSRSSKCQPSRSARHTRRDSRCCIERSASEPRKNEGDMVYRTQNLTTLASPFRVFNLNVSSPKAATQNTATSCYSVRPWQRTKKKKKMEHSAMQCNAAWTTKNAKAVPLLSSVPRLTPRGSRGRIRGSVSFRHGGTRAVAIPNVLCGQAN